MPEFLPNDGAPTAAEIFRVFRDTTMASISGLKLLLDECADVRAELVTIVDGSHDGDGKFSSRQRNRILELKEAALDMEALLASLPGEESASEGDGFKA
jgi:hypothetical protein